MSKEVTKPRVLAFEVTRRCRYNCRHCRAKASQECEDELSTKQCKKIISAVADYTRCLLIFTGGEAMEREDIYELIRHARKKQLRVALASCGYLIDEEAVAKLKEAGVMSMSLSIDGASAETHDSFRQTKGAFDEVLRAAKAAKEGGLNFQINTTISKLNVDEFVGIAELAKRLGASCFNPFILVPTGRGEEIWQEILDPVEYEEVLHELLNLKLNSGISVRVTCGPQFSRLVREKKLEKLGSVTGCIGGTEFGFISASGDVQTCGFLNIPAGNLVKEKFAFAKIWRESKFLNEIRDKSSYSGPCGVCPYLDVCGGCRARAYTMTGDYLGSDPVCELVHEEKG